MYMLIVNQLYIAHNNFFQQLKLFKEIDPPASLIPLPKAKLCSKTSAGSVFSEIPILAPVNSMFNTHFPEAEKSIKGLDIAAAEELAVFIAAV